MSFRSPRESAMFNERFDPETRAAVQEEENYPLNEDEEIIFQRTMKFEEDKPTMDDFNIPEKQRQRDQAWLSEKKRQKDAFKPKRGRILEYALTTQIESSDWLGSNCQTFETTEFDDRKGTDLVFEWQEQENGHPIHLAVDVTVGESQECIATKEKNIKEDLESGKLAWVKYFKSPHNPNIEGAIRHIPKVIIALSREGTGSLCKDIVNKSPGEMIDNPEQLLILEQIKQQMIDQIEYILGLLLEEIALHVNQLNKEGKDQLIELVTQSSQLSNHPETIKQVIVTLQNQKEMLRQLNAWNKISMHFDNIGKHQTILELAENLIKEKSDLLEPQVVRQAADLKKTNIVLGRVKERQSSWHLPYRLQNLAEAA